jgi:acylpyruvate hydrolase
MKIICIAKNYAAHARELKDTIPVEPVFFLKPDTSVLRRNRPFYYPDFSDEIHYEAEIVLKINRLGKNIAEKFAHRYFQEIGIGIDLTARDLQKKCREESLPWEISKAFESSAPINKFVNKNQFKDLDNVNFGLSINNKRVQQGNTKKMIFGFNRLIAYVSRFFTLKTGDLIFTGTPEGIGPVNKGDHLQADIENEVLLDFMIK